MGMLRPNAGARTGMLVGEADSTVHARSAGGRAAACSVNVQPQRQPPHPHHKRAAVPANDSRLTAGRGR